jgi:hypothetical protein
MFPMSKNICTIAVAAVALTTSSLAVTGDAFALDLGGRFDNITNKGPKPNLGAFGYKGPKPYLGGGIFGNITNKGPSPLANTNKISGGKVIDKVIDAGGKVIDKVLDAGGKVIDKNLAAQREREARLAAQGEREAQLAAQREREARLAAQREREAQLAAQREREARLAAQREREAQLAAQREREARLAAQREREAQRTCSKVGRWYDPETAECVPDKSEKLIVRQPHRDSLAVRQALEAQAEAERAEAAARADLLSRPKVIYINRNDSGPAPVAPASVVSPVVTAPAPSCLTKEYLQAGTVLFKDVCTNQFAMNSTTLPSQVVTAATRACLTKENLQAGTVLFKDICTNEWAMNPPDQQAQAPQTSPVPQVR